MVIYCLPVEALMIGATMVNIMGRAFFIFLLRCDFLVDVFRVDNNIPR
jgi:hypothetical protein